MGSWRGWNLDPCREAGRALDMRAGKRVRVSWVNWVSRLRSRRGKVLINLGVVERVLEEVKDLGQTCMFLFRLEE